MMDFDIRAEAAEAGAASPGIESPTISPLQTLAGSRCVQWFRVPTPIA